MAKLIGLVNTGQGGRPDRVSAEMLQLLGSDFELQEVGALDGLSGAEIDAVAPSPGDYVIVTILRDGSSVRLAKKHLIPLMQKRIDELNGRGVDVISLTCAGTFPPFRSEKPVILPQPVLYNLVKGIAQGRRVGVMTPLPEQLEQSRRAWEEVGMSVAVVDANPYGNPPQLERASAELVGAGVDLVVMECFGHTFAMKETVRKLTGKPVVLARSVLARVLGELA